MAVAQAAVAVRVAVVVMAVAERARLAGTVVLGPARVLASAEALKAAASVDLEHHRLRAAHRAELRLRPVAIPSVHRLRVALKGAARVVNSLA